jgi:hypothetical protein
MTPSQFLYQWHRAQAMWEMCSHPYVLALMPPRLHRALLALNGAYAIFADSLYGGATEFSGRYRDTEGFQLAQNLWRGWQAKYPKLDAGGVYDLIDDFGEMLGLRNRYEWRIPPLP